MIKNKLLRTVTLPYKQIKGSEIQRHQNSCAMANRIVRNLSGQLQGEGISLSKFSREFRKLIPQNLSLSIQKHKSSDSNAALNRAFAGNNYIVRHIFELSTNKSGKVDILQLPTIAHEVQHLTDSLYNPKIVAREQILAKTNMYEDKFMNFYEEEVYVPEGFRGKKDKRTILKIIEHKTDKILRRLKIEDKINFLQYMRYNLILEKNAYKAGNKCAKSLNKKNIPVYEDELCDYNKEYLFDEKISLIKNYTYKLIKKEREIHAKKIKKSSQLHNRLQSFVKDFLDFRLRGVELRNSKSQKN